MGSLTLGSVKGSARWFIKKYNKHLKHIRSREGDSLGSSIAIVVYREVGWTPPYNWESPKHVCWLEKKERTSVEPETKALIGSMSGKMQAPLRSPPVTFRMCKHYEWVTPGPRKCQEIYKAKPETRLSFRMNHIHQPYRRPRQRSAVTSPVQFLRLYQS